jgi:hypothetical protein
LTPAISTLGKLKQKESDFKVSLGYISEILLTSKKEEKERKGKEENSRKKKIDRKQSP